MIKLTGWYVALCYMGSECGIGWIITYYRRKYNSVYMIKLVVWVDRIVGGYYRNLYIGWYQIERHNMNRCCTTFQVLKLLGYRKFWRVFKNSFALRAFEAHPSSTFCREK